VESIAGVLIRFDEDGRVVEQGDVWATEPGRRELLDWARSRRLQNEGYTARS